MASLPTRRISKVFTAHRQREGAGFVVVRPFPSANLKDEASDPFLLLDNFGPKMVDHRSPGAPWHPHRGFDTVTYFKRGEGAHQDSMGNKGIVRAGEVQWMRAGSGIVHDEGGPNMKPNDPPQPMEGFQLWVNLPAALKMSPPSYKHLTAESFQWRDFTAQGSTGTRIKVVAGTLGDDDDATSVGAQLGESLGIPILYADVELAPGATCTIPVPPNMETCLVYVYKGTLRAFNGDRDSAGASAKRGDCVVFAAEAGALRISALDAAEYPESTRLPDAPTDDDLETEAFTYRGAAFLIIAGQPIREPIARHGPFVMNTNEELLQAFHDYESGKLAKVRAQETKY